MFTGLIQAIGKIQTLKTLRSPLRSPSSSIPSGTSSGTSSGISAPFLNYEVIVFEEGPFSEDLPIMLGESISLMGVCQSVTSVKKIHGSKNSGGRTQLLLSFEAGEQTLKKTTLANWKVGQEVHIERALRAGDRVGGHFVSGHIALVGEVIKVQKLSLDWAISFQIPVSYKEKVISEGSIAIDGVSYTISEVQYIGRKCLFSINVLPLTYEKTLIKLYRRGTKVNIEFDFLNTLNTLNTMTKMQEEKGHSFQNLKDKIQDWTEISQQISYIRRE